MAKHLRITVEGKAYDVVVEDLSEDAGSTFYQTSGVGMAPAASVAPPPATALAAKPAAAAAPAAGAQDKVAPMGGVIVEISVKVGDAVKAGQQICLLEAMKMKQIITSDHDGKVTNILVKVGDTVDAGQPLMTIA
jgi:biotin carboxyl carrier protein